MKKPKDKGNNLAISTELNADSVAGFETISQLFKTYFDKEKGLNLYLENRKKSHPPMNFD